MVVRTDPPSPRPTLITYQHLQTNFLFSAFSCSMQLKSKCWKVVQDWSRLKTFDWWPVKALVEPSAGHVDTRLRGGGGQGGGLECRTGRQSRECSDQFCELGR